MARFKFVTRMTGCPVEFKAIDDGRICTGRITKVKRGIATVDYYVSGDPREYRAFMEGAGDFRMEMKIYPKP